MYYNSALLLADAEKLGISLSDDALAKFDLLAHLMIEQNKTMNLTAITDPDGIAVKHVADSISALTAADFIFSGFQIQAPRSVSLTKSYH